MLEGKAVVGETDMLQTMQQYALDLASKALDCFDVTEATDIARFIKKIIVGMIIVSATYVTWTRQGVQGSSFGHDSGLTSFEFDRTYGAGWQCIVGTDFGSFVTHCSGCFIYFCIGSLSVLLFKGSAGPGPGPDAESNQISALETIKA